MQNKYIAIVAVFNILLLGTAILLIPLGNLLTYNVDITNWDSIDSALWLAAWVDSILGTDYVSYIKSLLRWLPKDRYGDDLQHAVQGELVDITIGSLGTVAEILGETAELIGNTPDIVKQAVKEAHPQNLFLSVIDGLDETSKDIVVGVREAPTIAAWYIASTGKSSLEFITTGNAEFLLDISDQASNIIFAFQDQVLVWAGKVPVFGKPSVAVYNAVIKPGVDFAVGAANSIAKITSAAWNSTTGGIKNAWNKTTSGIKKAWNKFKSWF